MRRQCWICYLEDDTESEHTIIAGDEWIQPCRCSGSTQWVHQSCLLAWIDKCLAGAAATPTSLACPQCHHPYAVEERLVLPRELIRVIDWAVSWRSAVSFSALLGSVGGSVWVLCTIYGASTFTVCVGPEEAFPYFAKHGRPLWSVVEAVCLGARVNTPFSVLLRSWWKLVVGMPAIPLAILSQKYRFFSRLNPLVSAGFFLGGALSPSGGFHWTPGATAAVLPWAYRGYQSVLSGVRNRIGLQRSASSLYTLEGEFDEDEEAEMTLRVSEDSVAILLLLPAASAFLGRLLFNRLDIHGFHRTCLGGLVLQVATDTGRLLYRWQADYSKRSRRVLDFRPKKKELGMGHSFRYNSISLL